MRAGYQNASGDIIIVLDADGSNDPREIPRFIMALSEGSDFVKGSRFAPGGGTTDMSRVRQIGNKFFVFLVNLFFNVHFTDLCYGYHAFWRYCLDDLNLDDVNGFEIDTAIYVRSLLMRLRLTEVPSFEGYRFRGEGKLRTIPDGFRVIVNDPPRVGAQFTFSTRRILSRISRPAPGRRPIAGSSRNRKRIYFVKIGRHLV